MSCTPQSPWKTPSTWTCFLRRGRTGSIKPTATCEAANNVDLGLKNKVAVVAAASKGLGRAVALELAKEGARVAICSRNRDHIRQTAEFIHLETGAEVYYEQVDVAHSDE